MSAEEINQIAEALLSRVVEFREKSDLFPMALQDANGDLPADFELQWDMNLVLPFFMACYLDGWKAGKQAGLKQAFESAESWAKHFENNAQIPGRVALCGDV